MQILFCEKSLYTVFAPHWKLFYFHSQTLCAVPRFGTKVSYFHSYFSPEHQGISGNGCDLYLGGVHF